MKFNIRRERFISIVFHPAFLAIPLTIILMLIMDVSWSPFQLRLLEQEKNETRNARILYADINSNSGREKILAYDLPTNATVIAFVKDRSIYEAWNLRGFWAIQPEFHLYDHDGDGVMELYGLTIGPEDSLFLTQLHLIPGQDKRKEKFITCLNRINGVIDHQLINYGFADISGDGHEDFIFQVGTGFTLQPRAFYAWDLKNDHLLRSPYAGINSNYTRDLKYLRLPSLNQNVFFTDNSATDNYKTNIAYPDTSSYVVLFKPFFEYLFPPIALGGPQSHTRTYPFKHNDQMHIFALLYDQRKAVNRATFHLFDLKGNLIKKKNTTILDTHYHNFWFNGKIILMRRFRKHSEIGILNDNFTYKKKKIFNDLFIPMEEMNLDGDLSDELILVNEDGNKVGILEDNLKDFTYLELPIFHTEIFNISIRNKDENGVGLFLHVQDQVFNLYYTKNKLYPIRNIVYGLLYLPIFLFLLLLRKVFIFTNNRRRDREQKLIDYQLQSVMNQLNPHFTFNAINSIGEAVISGRNIEAYEYFTKLSDLIRKSMKNAFQPYKTLGEEIEFVEEYLEIEQYRFGEKLSWQLFVDPMVDLHIPVPKMLIHIFVENSIKHGIFHMKNQGEISINVEPGKNGAEITVTDNGLGFKKVYESLDRSGNGLKILDNYLEIYNSRENRTIHYHISDAGQGEDTGTKITILIR